MGLKEAFDFWQSSTNFHPFTCGNGCGNLEYDEINDVLYCKNCYYKQPLSIMHELMITQNYEPISKSIEEEEDTFFDDSALLEKLKKCYEEHGKIIVAFDYDDTIAPTFKAKSCKMVIQLLKDLRDYAVFICYTSNEDVEKVKSYIKENEIPLNCINENIDFMKEKYDNSGKVYYNIFFDDKAGLGQTYRIGKKFLEWVRGIK